MKIAPILIAAILIAGTAFAAEPKQAPKTNKTVKALPAQAPTLIFFMNPNGTPCQMQYKILQDGMTELSKVAKIRYVKTTEPADQDAFYQYGIRSLPNLILVDSTGKEMVRFPPGIQEMAAIMNNIRK